MKKIFFALSLTVLITSFSHGQSFENGGKYLNLGIGGSSFWHLGGARGLGFAYTPITGQLNVQMEFGIHEYVGIGFTTGFGGNAGYGIYGSEFNIPVGAIANFHFWQLIANKTGKGDMLMTDRLDVYAGLNIGTGLGLVIGGGVTPAALFYAGPQVGVRYFFTDKIGVNGEIGYGKSWVNGGVVFKL